MVARTAIGPALRRDRVEPLFVVPLASVLGEPGTPQKFQPMWVPLTGQQLRGAFVDSIGVFAAQVSAVVQEKLKQRQVVVP